MLKDYLGDGVYALFDGNGIELCANDHENPTDTIYLEIEVLEALNRFANRCNIVANPPIGSVFYDDPNQKIA